MFGLILSERDRLALASEVSPYLLLAPRSLHDACSGTGRDDDGRRCAGCSVRLFCEQQVRSQLAEAAR